MTDVSPLPDLTRQADELAEKADDIRARMEEHTIDLVVAGKTNGEWRRWASAHPAREAEEDPAGHQRDKRHAALTCNVDDLIGDLGLFITKYGDEAASDEWWEFVSENAAPGDLTRLASTVVGMHEQVVDPGKSRVAWLNDRKSANASE